MHSAPPPRSSESLGASEVSGSSISLMSLSADEDVAGVSSVSAVRSSVVPAGYTEIRTAEDLMKIADNMSGKYILTGDIDLSSVKNWEGVGGASGTFTGTLDGNGHTIKNLDMTGQNLVGLFSSIENAEVKNLTIDNFTLGDNASGGLAYRSTDCSISNIKITNLKKENDGSRVGGLIAQDTGSTIKNCSVSSSMTIKVNYGGGGLIGTADGSKISGCISFLNLDTMGGTGGIIGSANNCTITDSNYKGKITSLESYSHTGGLIGRCENSTVSNCSTITDIDGGYNGTGGLIGSSEKNIIKNCSSKGNITGELKTGGLIGNSYDDIEITDCYHTGDINGSGSQIGGFIGNQLGSSTKISNCYSKGNVTGNIFTDVGGFIGYTNGSISNCYSDGTVKGYMMVGGFVGSGIGTIKDSYSLGYVEGTSTVGGFAGRGNNISNCFSKGNVRGESDIGGFAGWGNTISESYCEGDVTGNTSVGGFGGFAGSINDCYAKGDVTPTTDGGGFAWEASNISNSYFQGSISGGDVYGFSYLFYDVSNVFFDVDKAGTDKAYKEGSGTVTGLSSSEMRNEQNFIDAGWDETIWFMNIAPPTLVRSPKAYDADFNIRLQVGADSSKSSCMHVNTYIEMDSFSVDFSSAENCASAIDEIDELLNMIGKKMSDFGAVLNRLDSVLSSQRTTIENLTAAKSTIMDADIAKESAEFVKNQILQQTTSALLVQAQSVHSTVIMAMIQR